jgi:hypothetical protein
VYPESTPDGYPVLTRGKMGIQSEIPTCLKRRPVVLWIDSVTRHISMSVLEITKTIELLFCF